jgi:PiT family inorganic phosphate transporter
VIAAAGLAAFAGLLAYANGANDVSKGVATLVGSGVTSYRRALAWGAAWIGLGAAAAAVVAGAMLATFGSGLLDPDVTPSFAASLAAIAGAAAWVLLATRTGLPVSTTHAIVGAVVGAAFSAYGPAGVAWSGLFARVVLPLALSPLVAIGLAYLLSRGMKRTPAPAGDAADCVCVTATAAPAPLVTAGGALAFRSGGPVHLSVTSGDTDSCPPARTRTLRITEHHLHWLSSGAVSFARGLNDAPKIVALALGVAALSPATALGTTGPLFALIVAAMVTGSVLGGRRVTKVLARDITPMTHREGLAANLVAAALVTAGAVHGLPMSTTHVASGGIFGIGADRRTLDWSTVRTIVLAWIVTLPAAAVLAAMAYALLVGAAL